MVAISVIIRVHKETKYLPLAIKSVLNQSFQDFEIVIVDDCSPHPQKILTIISRFNDDRIKYIRNLQKQGTTKSLLTGFKNAKGEFITILDNDDIYLPHNLLTNYQYFREVQKMDNSVIAVLGWHCLINKGNSIISKLRTPPPLAGPKNQSVQFNCLDAIFTPYINSTAIMLKKEISNFPFNNFYHPTTTADLHSILLFALSRKYNIYFHKEVVGLYRKYQGSYTTYYSFRNRADDYIKISNLLPISHKWSDIVKGYIFYLLGSIVKGWNLISSRHTLSPFYPLFVRIRTLIHFMFCYFKLLLHHQKKNTHKK